METTAILLDPVKSLAIKAGEAIMEVYTQDSDIQIENKADDSPLTIADKRANKIICDGLLNLNVSYPIISEENKQIPYEQRREYRRYWLVDPLDGTKEFIKRNGEFTVNIALIENNKPILGVVYAPALHELFWGGKNLGAYYSDGQSTHQLTTQPFKMTDKNLKVVCSRSHLNDETKRFFAKLNDPIHISKGSSLKLMILAKGDAHLYPRLGPTMEWDIAAAQSILEAAGGFVRVMETGSTMEYNKEELLNPYFLASGTQLS